jgi:LPXTG-site transpeptidase (sortase) family protein
MSNNPFPNPLFPPRDDADKDGNPAIELVRAKVARVFSQEPSAVQELAEVQQERVLSKHQHFMQELSNSSKSLAEIQTAWHHYYTTLSDAEKHEVWQEFYDANRHTPYQRLFPQNQAQGQTEAQAQGQWQPAGQAVQPVGPRFVPAPNVPNGYVGQNGVVVADHTPVGNSVMSTSRHDAGGPGLLWASGRRGSGWPKGGWRNKANARQIKDKILGTVNAGGKLTAKHHLQSLMFGLGTGMLVLVLFLFTFFNEYVIAPFIQPSRNVSSTPIILGNSTVSADAPPSVTIPKINIQIPLDFTVASYDESVVEEGLKTGAIHYPNTVLPGQNGNGAYFGHSSGNIFNNGKYKFAFTLLHNLTTGDLFYITYGGKTYAYRIFAREVVPPTAVSIISDTKGKQATAALITCDPPGLSTNRLVLWGEQISPSPTTNTAAAPTAVNAQPEALTDNGPTLWSQFVNWAEFWN